MPPRDCMCCTTVGQLLCLLHFPLLPRASMCASAMNRLSLSICGEPPAIKYLTWSMYHQGFAVLAATSESLERQTSRCFELFRHPGRQAWKDPRCTYVCLFVYVLWAVVDRLVTPWGHAAILGLVSTLWSCWSYTYRCVHP